MHKTNHTNDSDKTLEISNIIDVIKSNVMNNKKTIKEIDSLIDNKYISQSMLDILVSQRNACAINVMNFVKVACLI